MAEIYAPANFTGASRLPLDPARCKAGVHGRERWSRYSQCNRKAVLDGWCKQHHPDEEAARNKAATAKFEADARRDAMGSYGEMFMAALIRIRDGDNDPRATAEAALAKCRYTDVPR